MLQAFIITLREGVEAALIVGITLAYLAKIGRNDLRKTVYAALGAAFLGSIGVAIVISRLNWNEDVFEGWVMLAAAFFVVTMIIFMMKTGRKLKGQIEGKVGLLAGNDAWVGLFFFVFLMVLREGAETVLILSAVSLNSTELMSFLGTLLGVLAAVAFGVMFVKGSVRINLQKFFRVTTAILFLVALQLVVAGSARAVGERRDCFLEAGDGHHRAHRAQRFFLLRDDYRSRGADGFIRCQASTARPRTGFGGGAAQSRLDRSQRTLVDGFGVRLFLRLHRVGHGGVYLCQERERSVASYRS